MATPSSSPTRSDAQACRDALFTAAKILEQARCQETALEAELLFASELLAQPTPQSVQVEDMYGGIQDAFQALGEISKGVTSTTSNVEFGQGQVAKAAYNKCLAGRVQRASAASAEIQAARLTEGPVLETACQVAKEHQSVWLDVFDERVRSIQEYHARHAPVTKRQRVGNPAIDGYDLAGEVRQELITLSDEVVNEEVLGRYLDLRSLYETVAGERVLRQIFTDKQQSPLLYTDFLQALSDDKWRDERHESVKLEDRRAYVRFLIATEDYLRSFLQRTSPLLDVDSIAKTAVQRFEDTWAEHGGVEGSWSLKPVEATLTKSTHEHLNLAPYRSAEELAQKVDGDTLKTELARLGLKCGGTVQDRAKRLFLTKDTALERLPQKMFAKKSNAGDSNELSIKSERRVDIARREAVVFALLGQLRPTLEATIRRSERRQTQTLEEHEQEVMDELYMADVTDHVTESQRDGADSEDDEDGPIYNPKNVPLDWDGKPIPYWLFKLHGLNHYYPCEICGGESYRGRRNYELHFAEQKHALGMKSLGIPNTKHFHGVTKIEDAQELWTALQAKLQQEQFDNSVEEEYEDSHGNVLTRTKYEDLARQGLL